MATLAEIRAKLQAAQTSQSSGFSGDNQIYAHWNMDEGKNGTVRFLPDADPNNTFFWVERQVIKLPFAGVVGDPTSKPVIVQVPCVEMYNDGSVCPVLTEVRPWFKDKSLEDMGRRYWKKRSYLFQGFVVDDPMNEENVPENPIRRFIIGPQIFQLIKAALLDPELEELPTDVLRGVDFLIAKTSKGGYADYSTSKWKRNERALSDTEQAAIAANGLFTLSDFLPKKPGEIELKVIKEMFEASVDGEAYDLAKWGQYYKPAGMKQATGDPNATPAAATPAATPAVNIDEEAKKIADSDLPFAPGNVSGTVVDPAPQAQAPAATPTPAEGDNANRAQDILAMIRNRQKTS